MDFLMSYTFMKYQINLIFWEERNATQLKERNAKKSNALAAQRILRLTQTF